MLAVIRPDSWNFPLFLHVLGAMVLVGAVAAVAVLAAASRDRPWLRRIAFRAMLLVVIPAWLLMRVAGQWTDSKEDISGDPTWLGIGFVVGDAGILFLLLATIFAWIATRRGDRRWPAQTVAVLAGIYLIALLVAMFAMTGKPGS